MEIGDSFYYDRKVFIQFSFFYAYDVNLLLYRYNSLSNLEKKAIQARRFSEFVMLLVYMISFIHLITIIVSFFGIEHQGMLSYPLLFSLIYIECKREPNKESYLYFFKVKSKSFVIQIHSFLLLY